MPRVLPEAAAYLLPPVLHANPTSLCRKGRNAAIGPRPRRGERAEAARAGTPRCSDSKMFRLSHSTASVAIEFDEDGLHKLGRHMVAGHADAAHISRCQAVLRKASSGSSSSLAIESRGANKTGVQRQGRGPWHWLAKGEHDVVASGDCIALNASSSAGMVWTLNSADATSAGSPAGSAAVGVQAGVAAAAAHVYERGDAVLYQTGSGQMVVAQIVGVHHETSPPHYTILCEGSERQTEGDRLGPLDVAAEEPEPPPPAPKWSWCSGREGSNFTNFAPQTSVTIEAAFAAGAKRVAIDEQRHVDFALMRQVRNDDPSRYRAVRRDPPPPPSANAAAGQAASANAAFSQAASANAAASSDGDAHKKRQRVGEAASASATSPPPLLGFALNRLEDAWVASGLVPSAANASTIGLAQLLCARWSQHLGVPLGYALPAACCLASHPARYRSSAPGVRWITTRCSLLAHYAARSPRHRSPRHRSPPRSSPSVLHGALELHIHNFMIDLDFVVECCPAILSVPRVVVLHGDGRPPQARCVRSDPHRFVCLQPPCEVYTHTQRQL